MPTRSLCLLVAATLLAMAALFRFGLNVTSATTAMRLDAPETLLSKCFNPRLNIRLTGKSCGTVPDLQLSCYLPADMVPAASPSPSSMMPLQNFNTLQRAADIFSWQEFFALNWPARPGMRGEPDIGKRIHDAGPRVWGTWKEEYEVYLTDGRKPKPWNDQEPVPSACGGEKIFFRTQKIHDVVDATLQAAVADGTLPATLTDQKGKVVRYEIRLNKMLFDHVMKHRLYNGGVQSLAK